MSAVGLRDVAALLCMNEAAVAWRAGDAATARSLSARAQRQWTLTGWVPGLALVQPLAMLCGEAVGAEEERLLLARVRALPLSRVAVQSLALLAKARPRRRRALSGIATPYFGLFRESGGAGFVGFRAPRPCGPRFAA